DAWNVARGLLRGKMWAFRSGSKTFPFHYGFDRAWWQEKTGLRLSRVKEAEISENFSLKVQGALPADLRADLAMVTVVASWRRALAQNRSQWLSLVSPMKRR